MKPNIRKDSLIDYLWNTYRKEWLFSILPIVACAILFSMVLSVFVHMTSARVDNASLFLFATASFFTFFLSFNTILVFAISSEDQISFADLVKNEDQVEVSWLFGLLGTPLYFFGSMLFSSARYPHELFISIVIGCIFFTLLFIWFVAFVCFFTMAFIRSRKRPHKEETPVKNVTPLSFEDSATFEAIIEVLNKELSFVESHVSTFSSDQVFQLRMVVSYSNQTIQAFNALHHSAQNRLYLKTESILAYAQEYIQELRNEIDLPYIETIETIHSTLIESENE